MGLAFKIRDAESYRERLNRFLSDRCLLFNPYLIPDEQLIDAATHQKWRGLFSLTQMVILRFVRVECEKQSFRDIEHVTYRVGDPILRCANVWKSLRTDTPPKIHCNPSTTPSTASLLHAQDKSVVLWESGSL